jgi:hypothetical protein
MIMYRPEGLTRVTKFFRENLRDVLHKVTE